MITLHHISVPTRNLEKSRAFYRDIIGLTERARPNMGHPGAWFAMDDQKLHLIETHSATYRPQPIIDTKDIHHAFRVPDFEAALDRAISHGYSETAGPEAPLQLLVRRSSPTAFLQAYLVDPDWNIVELNTAPFPQ
jgi:glyoxylase I family protein